MNIRKKRQIAIDSVLAAIIIILMYNNQIRDKHTDAKGNAAITADRGSETMDTPIGEANEQVGNSDSQAIAEDSSGLWDAIQDNRSPKAIISGENGIEGIAKEARISLTPEVNTETLQESDEIAEETVATIKELIKKYYASTKKIDKAILLAEDGKSIDKAVSSILRKREGIEKYKSIKSYIRKGLQSDTYIVFTTYSMKFDNIETVVPGMSVLLVTKNEKGSFVIDNSKPDADLNTYITELSKEEEIAAAIEKVNTGFNNAIKKDKTLNKFVNNLKEAAKE